MNVKTTYEAPEVELVEMVDDIMTDSSVVLPEIPLD